jgi:hypothetical protein
MSSFAVLSPRLNSIPRPLQALHAQTRGHRAAENPSDNAAAFCRADS